MFYMIGVVGSAIVLAPIAVAIAAVIVAVMCFNFLIRELMLAAWDISVQAISDIESFVNGLVSEKTSSVASVAKEVNAK